MGTHIYYVMRRHGLVQPNNDSEWIGEHFLGLVGCIKCRPSSQYGSTTMHRSRIETILFFIVLSQVLGTVYPVYRVVQMGLMVFRAEI
jgi:hypothetical protein